MIQRIQSVYLLLLIIAFSTLFFIPLSSTIDTEKGQFHVLSVTEHKVFEGNTLANTTPEMMLIISAILVIALSVITILLFKNRKIQMLLCKLLMILIIGFILIAFKETDSMSSLTGAKAIYQIGAYVAIITLLLVYLALNAIKKDEELVRSADRLR